MLWMVPLLHLRRREVGTPAPGYRQRLPPESRSSQVQGKWSWLEPAKSYRNRGGHNETGRAENGDYLDRSPVVAAAGWGWVAFDIVVHESLLVLEFVTDANCGVRTRLRMPITVKSPTQCQNGIEW